MKSHTTDLITTNAVFIYLAIATGLVLLIPLTAMQFSSQVQWGPVDFTIIGTLLFGMGSLFILAARKIQHPTHRILLGIAIAAITVYVWTELAVGIVTNLGS